MVVMLVRDVVEFTIQPAVSLERAREVVLGEGFAEQAGRDRYYVFRGPGSAWTVLGDRAAVKIGLARTPAGLLLLLDYVNPFVLAGGGRLKRIGGRLSERLRQPA
jgi:hypothetical protein